MNTTDWQIASNVASLIVAAIALFLLGQGLHDRRQQREQEDRDQASRVSVTVKQNLVPDSPGIFTITSSTIRCRNDSDLPVTLNSGYVTLHRRLTKDQHQSQVLGEAKFVPAKPLQLSESFLRPHEELEGTVDPRGWDYAVLRFTDASGQQWARISSTGLLYQVNRPAKRRSAVYMSLAEVPGLKQVLSDWPNKYVNRRIAKTDMVPLTARWIRFWWGVVPIGEPDPWEIPQNVDPREWPYDGLLSLARLTRLIRQREQTSNDPPAA